jgi:hypothetical protein
MQIDNVINRITAIIREGIDLFDLLSEGCSERLGIRFELACHYFVSFLRCCRPCP